MRMINRIHATWLSLVLCTAVSSPTIAGAGDSRLAIRDAGKSYELTVPVSRLVLSVPTSVLAIRSNNRGGANERCRYFYLADAAYGVIVSGWFEPATRYTDLGESWRQEMEHMQKEGFPAPQGVEQSEIGTWRAIRYTFPLPN